MSLLDDIRERASDEYLSYAAEHPDRQAIGELVVLYGQDEVEERNATYVQQYLPGWFTIGDDSGGMALLMRLDGSHDVYRCGHGAIGSAAPEHVSSSFHEWLLAGCPLPDDDEPELGPPLRGDLWLSACPDGGLKDLLALKNLLRIDIGLGTLRECMQTVPCVLARDIQCVVLAERARARPELAACIAFSDPGGTEPQYGVS